jgi:cobalamin biosynthesis protein CbiD
MNLEHELRKALERRDPPDGFAQAVMARIAAGETIAPPDNLRVRARSVLPLAATVLLAVGGAYYMHQEQRQTREEQMRAEQAMMNVSRALHITSETLATVRAKLQEAEGHEQTIHP